MSGHTAGPWAWQMMGTKYCLVGQHSMRPIVLSVSGAGPNKGNLTSLVDGYLKPIDPAHPDAILIAAAPDLLLELRRTTEMLRMACLAITDNEARAMALGQVKSSNSAIAAATQPPDASKPPSP